MNYAVSQRHNWNTSQMKKRIIFWGHTFPRKNAAGNVFLSTYEISIGFQAKVTTSQANFFKIPYLWYDFSIMGSCS